MRPSTSCWQEEAKLAKLYENLDMCRLAFTWGRRGREINTYDNNGNVLEGLQTNTNLQEFEIQNFMGFQFPNWFMNLSALKLLVLSYCKRCRELPILGQLPSLQDLYCGGLET